MMKIMWKIMLVSLFLLVSVAPLSLADDGYPACWTSELKLIDVSAHYYGVYFSLLEKAETVEDLVDFAEGYLPYRERDTLSNDRCAESIEFAWLSQREISLRAAYKAVDYGLWAKIDAEPAVLAQYNPARGVIEEPFYPEGFNRHMALIQALIDNGDRDYRLSPDDGGLPVCTEAELASMASVLPDYQRVVSASQSGNTVDDLLQLADMQLSWRENWSQHHVTRYDDGRLSLGPRDGLFLLPACGEAAELLWLMDIAINDASSSAALTMAKLHHTYNPYIESLIETTGKIRRLTDRIRSAVAAPGAAIRRWTTCTDAQRDALKGRLPQLRAVVFQEPSFETAEAFTADISGYISWRDELWLSLPDCADAVETALAFSQLASDRLSRIAYWWAGTPNETNPFDAAIELGDFVAEGYGSGLVGGSAVRLRPARLRACTEAEFETLAPTVAQYDMLREAMTNIHNMREFVDAAEAVLVWRDSLLSDMPACKESFEMSVLMSQIADDYIALLGLTYAGYGRDSNPYIEWFLISSGELTNLVRAAPIGRGSHEVAWNYGGQLDSCGADQFDKLGQILREYLALQDMGQGIASLEALAAFGDAQLAWRTKSWPELPNCAEAFEIGLHIYRTAGNQIGFNVPAVAKDQLANVIGGNTMLRERLGEIFAELPLKWRPEHTGDLVTYPRHCSVDQTATIVTGLREFLRLIEDRPAILGEPVGILAYVNRRISWRQTSLAGMSRCLIVYDLDAIPEIELAKGLASSIPLLGAFVRGSDIIDAIAAALSDGEDRVRAVQPYGNRMPLCSEEKLRSLQDEFTDYTDLINQVPDISTKAGLYDYIKRRLIWRKEVWARMPVCAESLEVGFLIHQIASDISTAVAFGYHDLSEDENPYTGLEGEGREALQQTRGRIAELIRSGDRADTPSTAQTRLPRCTDDELDAIYGYTIDHHILPKLSNSTLSDLLDYVEHLLSWRAETWSPLPACVEAHLIGSIASRQTGDFVTQMALAWAPGERGRNPFYPDTREDNVVLVALTEGLRALDRAEIDRVVAENYPPGS